MARISKITVLGVDYPTLKAAAQALDIAEQTLITWRGTGNIDACALKHQKRIEKHEQKVIEKAHSVKSLATKDPFNLRVAGNVYSSTKTGLPTTSYRWEETPELLEKVRELVIAGLEIDQVAKLIRIPMKAFQKLMYLPESQIIAVIEQAKSERMMKAMLVRNGMIDGSYVAPDGKLLTQQVQAQMVRSFIDREDKLDGRISHTVVHQVDHSPLSRLTELNNGDFLNTILDADFTVVKNEDDSDNPKYGDDDLA